MIPDPLAGIVCVAYPVLNAYEQTLYNLCEEYFYLSQRKSNRHSVLSQVRLVDAIKVAAPTSYINGMQFTAFSFDILITDSVANPAFVFEADGAQHKVEPQKSLDALKDAIARKAGIPVFRLEVEGVHPQLEVVFAESHIQDFARDLEYPTTSGPLDYSEARYPDKHRVIEMADIEIRLIRAGWKFPPGWEFVTHYEQR